MLVRQFRYPAYVNGYDDLLIEAAAGVLDDETPEVRIRAEAEEETGYRLGERQKDLRGLHEPGRGHREAAFLRRRIRSLDADRQLAAASPMKARTSRCWNCRSIERSR